MVTRVSFSNSPEGTESHDDNAFGPSALTPAGHNGSTFKVVGGVTKYDGNTGEISQGGTSSVSMGSLANGEAGVLASLNRDGRPISPTEAKPTDLVNIGGVPTTVENAIRLNIIKPDALTGVANVSPEALREATGEAAKDRAVAAQVKAQADAKAAEAANRLAPISEGALNHITSNVSESTVARMVQDFAEKGEVSAPMLAQGASEAGRGIEPGELSAAFEMARQGFEAQAQSYAATQGVDLADFGDWAREKHPTEAKAAIQRHITSRDTAAAYGDLMGRYLQDFDLRNPQAVIDSNSSNGSRAWVDQNTGRVVIAHPQYGELSWPSAVKAGLLKK